MPELPEVETIRRQLEKSIVNKKIKSVQVLLPRLVKAPLAYFQKAVEGAIIEKVERRAKVLIIKLSSDWSLLIHLKLTGQLIFTGDRPLGRDRSLAKDRTPKYTHIIYSFTDNSQLFHIDLRQFGYVKLVKTTQISELLEKENYGPEPLDKDFTLDVLKKLLAKKPRLKIKPLLMDQQFIAGIGNVYADEICFYARVKPTRVVSSLNDEEIKKIFEGIKKILPEAISLRGSSVDRYVDTQGKIGGYVPFLKVYARDGQLCLKCRTKIQRIRLGGRSAHFCPRCQK